MTLSVTIFFALLVSMSEFAFLMEKTFENLSHWILYRKGNRDGYLNHSFFISLGAVGKVLWAVKVSFFPGSFCLFLVFGLSLCLSPSVPSCLP